MLQGGGAGSGWASGGCTSGVGQGIIAPVGGGGAAGSVCTSGGGGRHCLYQIGDKYHWQALVIVGDAINRGDRHPGHNFFSTFRQALIQTLATECGGMYRGVPVQA